MQVISIFFNILEDKKNNPNRSLEEIYQTNKKTNSYLKRINDNIINNHLHYIVIEEESINNARHEINIKNNSFMYNIYNTNKLS